MTCNTQKLSEQILSRSFFFLGFIFGLVLKDITFLLDDDKQYISRGWIYIDSTNTSIQDLCSPVPRLYPDILETCLPFPDYNQIF